jgi:hypothetical protein
LGLVNGGDAEFAEGVDELQVCSAGVSNNYSHGSLQEADDGAPKVAADASLRYGLIN